MQRIAQIGSFLKKNHRKYSQDLILALQSKGFIDLRASFLEILTYVCENENPSIKEVGQSCGLKKQTMTSHLNELEKRGYIKREKSLRDKREQLVHLTDYGEKFKVALLEVINDLEKKYLDSIGEVELERILMMLQNFHLKISTDEQQRLI